jgi:endoglucanase
LFGKSVYFGGNRVFGIIGNKAIHLVPRDERDKMPKIDDMYIDIGASDRESALSLVAPGDTGAFDGAVLEFGDGYLRAKAIDDRLGCAALLKILESDRYDGVTFAFTVQEEVGTRGAAVAAYRVSPEVAIVVESTTAADLPGVSQGKRVCEVGGGAVVPFMDGGTMYDRQLYDRVTRLATAQNISWQTKTYISGGTDAAAIQRSRGGVKTIAIAAPVRNLHSPACVGKISDFEAVHALASAFVGELCDE